MQTLTLKLYKKESSMLDSLEKFKGRLGYEIELSGIISEFYKLMYDLFKPQLKENENNFRKIVKSCTEDIKIEYRRTRDLNSEGFRIWHLSMFMIIQTFFEIVESKYSLKQKDEILRLFRDLLNRDFYHFIDLNCKKRSIPNIKDKLLKNYLVPKKKAVWENGKWINFQEKGKWINLLLSNRSFPCEVNVNTKEESIWKFPPNEFQPKQNCTVVSGWLK